MTTAFHSVKISEISSFLVKKLQVFEAQSLHATDSAEGVEADKPDIEDDEEDEDLDGLDEVEVEDQAESDSLYTSQTKLRRKQRRKMKTERNPKGWSIISLRACCGYYHY